MTAVPELPWDKLKPPNRINSTNNFHKPKPVTYKPRRMNKHRMKWITSETATKFVDQIYAKKIKEMMDEQD